MQRTQDALNFGHIKRSGGAFTTNISYDDSNRFGEKRSESLLHLEDLTFLATVAKQASLAIENAFLYDELSEQERLKHELEIARRIQLASLPQRTPQIPGLDISGTSIPEISWPGILLLPGGLRF